MSTLRLHIALLLGLASFPAAVYCASQAPDAGRVAQASALLAHCDSVQPEDLALLSPSSRAMLEDLAIVARHGAADLTEHHHLDFHSWLRRMRSGEDAIDASAAFRALCADGQFTASAIALQSLRAGEAVGNGRLAWVPLVAPGGSGYTTLGLVFSRTGDGAWGLELRSSLQHEWVLETPALSALRQRMEQAGPGLDDDELQPASACRAPAAPQPLESWEPQAAVERFEGIWFDLENLLPGPANAISTLQREALRQHADGLRGPADALAQAIHAEALYRSAFFRRGPLHDSAAWWTQLEMAVAMARDAAAGGAPVKRMAELVGHYARIVEHGTPNRPADLAKAAALYEWAAQQGDIGAIYLWAQYQWEGIGPVAPSCQAADRTLRTLTPPDGLLERAQLAIDCPDPALRNPAEAKALLEQVRTRQAQEPVWEDEPLEALELAMRCALVDPAGPGCAARQPLLFSGQLKSQQQEQDAQDAEYVDPDDHFPTDPSDPDYDANLLSPLPYSLRSVPHPWPAGWPESKDAVRRRQPGC